MEIKQTSQSGIDCTQVFTLRLWQERLNGDRWEWRGRVQDVVSGEVRYFRDWERLIEILQDLLCDTPSEKTNRHVDEYVWLLC